MKRRLRTLIFGLLRIEPINKLVFKLRFFYFVNLLRHFEVYKDEKGVQANDYSIKMLKVGRTSHRPRRLILPLSVIEAANKSGNTLSIGCRFETELLYLAAYGFDPKKTRGLDMISYSPWVDVGNMHDLPYQTSSQDTVILGWVLPYSSDPARAVSEVIRVLKDGGLVAVGQSYYPASQLAEMKSKGANVVDLETRVQTTNGILSLFSAHLQQVYWQHDSLPDREGTCSVIFSIKK